MLEYKLGIPTRHSINSIKCNTREYIFYTQKNQIQLINPDIPNSIINYSGHNSIINSIDILGTQLISCSNNIQIYDILNDESSIRRFHTDDPFKINQVVFINESVIASVDDNKMVKYYDLRQYSNYKPIQSYDDSKDSLNTITYDSEQYRTHCGSNDGMLYTYDLRMGLLYKDDFQNPITSISSSQGEILINSLNQDLILFNFNNKDKGFFTKMKQDVEYKVANAFLPLKQEDNNKALKVLLTGSEHGVLYGFKDHTKDNIRLRGNILSSMDCVDGSVVVGDDYGIEIVDVGT